MSWGRSNAHVETARWLLDEVRAEIDAMEAPGPDDVERVIRHVARVRASPTVIAVMARLAGVKLLSRELDYAGPGLVSRLITIEQRRVAEQRKEAS